MKAYPKIGEFLRADGHHADNDGLHNQIRELAHGNAVRQIDQIEASRSSSSEKARLGGKMMEWIKI